ncbi:unnamed protein product [Symbiodinium microadriaticum]|nr:unnamed protein product [Symbiodinium microadriaticum]CAE7945999.1 unnamed protein product [Symbiodinium sp. KB8]
MASQRRSTNRARWLSCSLVGVAVCSLAGSPRIWETSRALATAAAPAAEATETSCQQLQKEQLEAVQSRISGWEKASAEGRSVLRYGKQASALLNRTLSSFDVAVRPIPSFPGLQCSHPGAVASWREQLYRDVGGRLAWARASHLPANRVIVVFWIITRRSVQRSAQPDMEPEPMEGQEKRASGVEAELQAVRQGVQDLAEHLRGEQQKAFCCIEQQISELRALIDARPRLDAEAAATLSSAPTRPAEPAEYQTMSLEDEVRVLRVEMDAVNLKMKSQETICTSQDPITPPCSEVSTSREVSEIQTQIVEVVRREQEAFRDRYLLEASNCAESVKNLELTMGHVSRELNKLLQKVGEEAEASPNRAVTFDGVLCNSSKTTLQGASFEGRDDVSPSNSPGRESSVTAIQGLESAATCSPMEPTGGLVQWSRPSQGPYTQQPVNVHQEVTRCGPPVPLPQYNNAQPANVWRRSLGNPSAPAHTPPPPSAPMYFRSRSQDGPTPPAQDRVVIATKMASSGQEQTTTPIKSMPRMVATPQMVKDPFREARDVKVPSRATIAVPFARDWKGQVMPPLSMAIRSSGLPAAPQQLMRVTQVQTRVV